MNNREYIFRTGCEEIIRRKGNFESENRTMRSQT